jgi:predicted RNA-binding Zn-ribbon protein involved in translation (DUF1610 family)
LGNKNVHLIKECDECGSTYYSDTSKMDTLCPECSHQLYSHEPCIHDFEEGRCLKCYWDGSVSDYLQSQRNK